MKKNLLLLLFLLTVVFSSFSQSVSESSVIKTAKKEKPSKKTKVLRKQHAKYLANTPFKKTLKLSKQERKSMGIPPNKYYEQEWELTMNPALGRPTPENIAILRKKLEAERARELASGRIPGDATDNMWVERGPNNVGGRTRALLFLLSDATNETVIAAGVSGGLWKNTNISNPNSAWTRVNIPENLNVSCITRDPNNSNILYVGTGESYVGGDVNGDGVWKSADEGVTWAKVFGGVNGATTFQSSTNVTVNTPIGIAGDYPCYPTNPANFGTAITTAITSDIVLIVDDTAPTSDGCTPAVNGAALSGKIALIRRGSCAFIDKVQNAQDAGAIAVIMMNNVDGTPIPMGGTSTTITIPSVMISKADGDLLEATLGSGSVNVTLNPTATNSFTGLLVPGLQHVNDIKVRNNAGVSEIYVAGGDTFYSTANATTYLGGPAFGLYKSVDDGANWTEIFLPATSAGNKRSPNDIAIGSDNKIWVATTSSRVYGDGGGTIYSSMDGVNFTEKYIVPGGDRTQIAISSTTPDKLYVLAEIAGGVTMKSTTDGFTNTTDMPLPVDADSSIPATDFARGQAFYDLMLEVDPANDNTVYTGGIDLFKSTNSGTNWTQLSHWYGGFGYQEVHSDQHGLAFANGNSSKLVFGNDGGVYYSGDGGTNTTSRNTGFNVTQFYSVGVAPTGATGGNLSGDYFAAGAQDNGTQYFASVSAGQNASVESQGGDGAYTMFDQGADKYYISNYIYNGNINRRTTGGNVKQINSESAENGAFICPMVLDSNRDALYSDYSTGTTYQIRRYLNVGLTGILGKAIITNALLTSPPTAFAVSKYTTTSTTLLVGTRLGKLLRVTNANTNSHAWSDITGPSFVGSISDVEYGMNETQIFVTMHNYGVVSIWYSSDSGATWQNKEGDFPDIPVKSILLNPLNTNEVAIGTELGVWFTNDFATAAPHWRQSYNGMRNVKVTDLDLRNDNTVFAATYGRGIFSGMLTSAILSKEEFVNNNNVTLYPNPSEGELKIQISKYDGNVTLQVVDLNGRLVLEQSNVDFSTEKVINLDSLQSGMYIVKLSGKNLQYTEKVLIK